jgi:pyrimidine-nucleoside phosphorylase
MTDTALEIAFAYEQIGRGQQLSRDQVVSLCERDVPSFQLAALATQMLLTGATVAEALDIVESGAGSKPTRKLLGAAGLIEAGDSITGTYGRVLRETSDGRPLGASTIRALVDEIVRGDVDTDFLAIWTSLLLRRELAPADVHTLTLALANSGETYDYRGSSALRGRHLLRRYPTGAVSEKLALLLPALISACRHELPVASTFLVARSLSFTGGTWDKLGVIDGFSFPQPGTPTLEVIAACGVAMVVTSHDCCPADRILYQFRSATGTVPSKSLMISSIASKQLALPVDTLLLDARYGRGAFMSTRTLATEVADRIAEHVGEFGTNVRAVFTDTSSPTGSAVGNALEVAEAVAVLNPSSRDADRWNRRAIEAQRDLLVDMFADLMAAQFAGRDREEFARLGERLIATGAAGEAFVSLLEAHGVDAAVAAGLTDDPRRTLDIATRPTATIRASSAGTVSALDQRTIGNVVTFKLGAGSNQYLPGHDSTGGVEIVVRPGDAVEVGTAVAHVFATEAVGDDLHDTLAGCFRIS